MRLLLIVIFPLVLLLKLFERIVTLVKGKKKIFSRRVAVIGGGIAGCAAAWSLKRSGYDVVIYEAREALGGNAKTFTWNNISGRPTTGLSVLAWPPEYFRNYKRLLTELGIEWKQVELPFYINKLDNNTNNIFSHIKDSHLRSLLKSDLTKWNKLVKFVRRTNDFFARTSLVSMYKMSFFNFLNFFPLRLLLICFGISANFWNFVIIPIYSSSFLSTKLTFIPSVIVPVIDDLIPLSQTPKLDSWLNNSSEVFQEMTKNIGVFLNHSVTAVRRVSENEVEVSSKGTNEKYNSVVFACPADTVLKCLHNPSILEYSLLNSISYVDDSDSSFLEGIIHSDPSIFPAELRAEILAKHSNYIEVTKTPTGHFNFENTFILSSWVPCVQPKPSTKRPSPPPMLVSYNCKKKIQNPLGTVSNARAHPDLSFRNLVLSFLIRLIQGDGNLYFCGSYVTPGNGHDLSLLSGFAVARAIGAEYPFPDDKPAAEDFARLRGLMGL